MTIYDQEQLAVALSPRHGLATEAHLREKLGDAEEDQAGTVEGLKEKFRMLRTGDRLMFCISQILGVDWVTNSRAMGGLSVTSDGFVISGGLFIGSVNEMIRNLVGACEAVGLDEAEMAAFRDLFYNTVTDWRMYVDHKAALYGNSPYK